MPSSKIGKYISILNRQSQKYLHHLVEQYGIGYSSYYFVMYIGANPKCSQREMAMATREMRRLEKSGYIIREKRPGNAKTYEISLSESGEKLYLKLKDKLTEWWGELLAESEIDPEPFSEQLRILAKAAHEKAAGMENQEKRTKKTR